jgi:serine/threonine protein phosphatase 1
MIVYCLTDIHGKYDLLTKALELIPSRANIVFLGDYIDRGPDSYKVINLIRDLQDTNPNVHVLLGNHEAMMVDGVYLKGNTNIWFYNGGLDTIKSYPNETELAYDAEWMKDLESILTIDNVTFVHAMASDNPQERIWGRYRRDEDAVWPTKVIHGHTPVKSATYYNNRVDLDTGAYHTGILTLGIVDTETAVVDTVEVSL